MHRIGEEMRCHRGLHRRTIRYLPGPLNAQLKQFPLEEKRPARNAVPGETLSDFREVSLQRERRRVRRGGG
jgi:hypothetical protein